MDVVDRQAIGTLLAQFEECKAEYARPDSMVDLGNLFWFACEFEKIIREKLS